MKNKPEPVLLAILSHEILIQEHPGAVKTMRWVAWMKDDPKHESHGLTSDEAVLNLLKAWGAGKGVVNISDPLAKLIEKAREIGRESILMQKANERIPQEEQLVRGMAAARVSDVIKTALSALLEISETLLGLEAKNAVFSAYEEASQSKKG